MDELTLTPVSKKEETANQEKPASSDSFEMAPISLNNQAAKDETEVAFEELNSKDIKSLMEQEKLERQKAKEAAANASKIPAPAPAPEKPRNENPKNKITEIMLTPPDEAKTEEKKAEDKKADEKPAEKPAENKGGNNSNNNKNKNKNKNGGNKSNNKPAPAPAPVPQVKKEEVKKGIEEIKIPDGMMNENKKVEPVQKPQNQSNLDSIETKKPVLVDVDENVAQAVGGMSFEEEFALLVKKEEQDNLTPDESRRLKICRLIDMKRKGKPFSDVAQSNFKKFMDEERKSGHDVSTFEAAMTDIAIASASEGKTASNPAATNLDPINNTKPAASQKKAAPTEEKKPVAKSKSAEKTGSDNKVLFIVIGIIAVLLIGMLIIIFSGKDENTPDTPVDTTVVTEAITTTEAPETTTAKAETTPVLSANNITKATVLEVISPDTLKVLLKDNSQATVKLIGVKAPVDKDYYAEESLEYVKNALTSKNINLEFDQKLTDDDHNILAYVWTNDGKVLFNDELIVMGYAKTELDEDNTKFNEEFTKVEEEAKAEKKGVWGYVAPVYTTKATTKPAVDPSKVDKSPYISRNLKVFHKNTCPLAYDEKYGKAIYRFESREEAIKYGCSPCSQCQP